MVSSALIFSNELTAQHKCNLNIFICQPLPSEAWLHSWHLCCYNGNKAAILEPANSPANSPVTDSLWRALYTSFLSENLAIFHNNHMRFRTRYIDDQGINHSEKGYK